MCLSVFEGVHWHGWFLQIANKKKNQACLPKMWDKRLLWYQLVKETFIYQRSADVQCTDKTIVARFLLAELTNISFIFWLTQGTKLYFFSSMCPWSTDFVSLNWFLQKKIDHLNHYPVLSFGLNCHKTRQMSQRDNRNDSKDEGWGRGFTV